MVQPNKRTNNHIIKSQSVGRGVVTVPEETITKIPKFPATTYLTRQLFVRIPSVAHHFDFSVILLNICIVDINLIHRAVRVLLFGCFGFSATADASERRSSNHEQPEHSSTSHHVRAPRPGGRSANSADVVVRHSVVKSTQIGRGVDRSCRGSWRRFGDEQPHDVGHSTRVVGGVYSSDCKIPENIENINAMVA